MGVQRQYKGVEGICRRVRGYVGVQRRYKGVEGICRRVRRYIGVQRRYKGVEGICRRYGDMWEYKDDTRGYRGYRILKGTGIYGRTKTIQRSRGDM